MVIWHARGWDSVLIAATGDIVSLKIQFKLMNDGGCLNTTMKD